MHRLKQWAQKTMLSRQPDFVVGAGGEKIYLQRWWIIPRNRFFNIYLHHFLASDDDRALHDHPFVNLSILLDGCYFEHSIQAGGVHSKKLRAAGKFSGVKFRLPQTAHRIELINDDSNIYTLGPIITENKLSCVTLFITGPRMREWGFHCPNGWRHWKEFTRRIGNMSVGGRGCEG